MFHSIRNACWHKGWLHGALPSSASVGRRATSCDATTMQPLNMSSPLPAEGAELLHSFRTSSRASVTGGAAAGPDAASPGEPGPGEAAIQRALYAGNFAAAVDAALEVSVRKRSAVDCYGRPDASIGDLTVRDGVQRSVSLRAAVNSMHALAELVNNARDLAELVNTVRACPAGQYCARMPFRFGSALRPSRKAGGAVQICAGRRGAAGHERVRRPDSMHVFTTWHGLEGFEYLLWLCRRRSGMRMRWASRRCRARGRSCSQRRRSGTWRRHRGPTCCWRAASWTRTSDVRLHTHFVLFQLAGSSCHSTCWQLLA